MSFDKNERRLCTAANDGSVKMWNFNNGSQLRQYAHHDERTEIGTVLFAADEKVRCSSMRYSSLHHCCVSCHSLIVRALMVTFLKPYAHECKVQTKPLNNKSHGKGTVTQCEIKLMVIIPCHRSDAKHREKCQTHTTAATILVALLGALSWRV